MTYQNFYDGRAEQEAALEKALYAARENEIYSKYHNNLMLVQRAQQAQTQQKEDLAAAAAQLLAQRQQLLVQQAREGSYNYPAVEQERSASVANAAPGLTRSTSSLPAQNPVSQQPTSNGTVAPSSPVVAPEKTLMESERLIKGGLAIVIENLDTVASSNKKIIAENAELKQQLEATRKEMRQVQKHSEEMSLQLEQKDQECRTLAWREHGLRQGMNDSNGKNTASFDHGYAMLADALSKMETREKTLEREKADLALKHAELLSKVEMLEKNAGADTAVKPESERTRSNVTESTQTTLKVSSEGDEEKSDTSSSPSANSSNVSVVPPGFDKVYGADIIFAGCSESGSEKGEDETSDSIPPPPLSPCPPPQYEVPPPPHTVTSSTASTVSSSRTTSNDSSADKEPVKKAKTFHIVDDAETPAMRVATSSEDSNVVKKVVPRTFSNKDVTTPRPGNFSRSPSTLTGTPREASVITSLKASAWSKLASSAAPMHGGSRTFSTDDGWFPAKAGKEISPRGGMAVSADHSRAHSFKENLFITPTSNELFTEEGERVLLTPTDVRAREMLVRLCTKHDVDTRTIAWFLRAEHVQFWCALGDKCGELDRRAESGNGTGVRNPSAWLTKYFNTLRNHCP